MMKIREIMNTKQSALATNKKGAHGPIESNMIPPANAKKVVPTDPKKKAIPDSVPLICGFMLRMKSTSTLMKEIIEKMIIRMQKRFACQSRGSFKNLKLVAIRPLAAKVAGTIILGSSLSLIFPKRGAIMRTEMREPITILIYMASDSC